MTAVLGISAWYHDSAAALVVDGEIVAAAQEERFTRKKQDPDFPKHAIEYCLGEAGLSPWQLDYVGFYEKPLLKFDRLLETYLAYAPRGFGSFLKAMPQWLRDKLHLRRAIYAGLPGYDRALVFPEHHESHAASAFLPSPFEEAAIITMDGVGEWTTGSIGRGDGHRVSLLEELHFPHSLGLLYSAFTYYCGFKVNSGEYKLMGLAPYGEPTYVDRVRSLMDLKDDGSFRMDMRYFNYCQGLTMTSEAFHSLFGGSPRKPESPLTQREMDIAASIQQVTEEVMLRQARHAQALTGSKNLCLAGGVALNCVGNGRILREAPFENVWIQPAAGDAGGALGTALFIWHQLLDNERRATGVDSQRGSLLGPKFEADEIQSFLDDSEAVYHHIADESELLSRVAQLMADGNVVGWMQGRMEFGPRALGCRSIIGDARSTEMQTRMNLKIKFRESFRPFAPSVLRERVADYYEMDTDSPYMLLVAGVHPARRRKLDDEESMGLDKLKQIRSDIPAITHVDFSARVQTVHADTHRRYHALLRAFEEKTGCGVVINTSFNVRGEPIVCSPSDAYRCFLATNMDVLVIEDYLLLKTEQPNATTFDSDAHLSAFALD